MRRKPLTIARLRAWANTKAPEAIVGVAGSCSECPLATYLTEQGVEDVRLTVPEMSFTDTDVNESRHSRLSQPMIGVIRRVDHLGWYRNVTAQEFRDILDSAEKVSQG